MRVSRGHLKDVCKVSSGFLEGVSGGVQCQRRVWKVLEKCLEDSWKIVWMASERCL